MSNIAPPPAGDVPTLSVIIPCINEEKELSELLPQLHAQDGVRVEVLVVDGGSADRSKEIAAALGARVLESPPGRGRQMNVGAAESNGSFLLFLHADSRPTAPQQLADAVSCLANESTATPVAGHFPLTFRTNVGSRPRAFSYYEAKTRLGRKDTINGDQGLLIRREHFFELGSFDESLSFLEDQRFAREVHARGRWILLPGEISTSARRFEQEGLARRMILSAITMGLHDIKFAPYFAHAKEIYRVASRSTRLDLRPFFAMIHRETLRGGMLTAAGLWLGVGRYVRENAWQLFFAADVAFGRRLFKRDIFLALHDRVFRPLTAWIAGDVIAACLTFSWFYCSWLYFSSQEALGGCAPARGGAPAKH